MMVHVRGPGTIQGYEPCGVDSAHEDVLRHKVSLAPSEQLVPAPGRAQRRVPALPHAQKPVPVRVVAVLEPFVDQHVRRVVVERLADQLAHRDARWLYRRVETGLFRRHGLVESGRALFGIG